MNQARRLLLCGCVGVLISCSSSMMIETQFEQDADFSTYHTWSWYPELQEQSVDPRISDPIVQKRIRKAIEVGFNDRGFMRTLNNPDFFVVYHAALKDGLSETTIDNWYDNSGSHAEYTTNWQTNYSHAWQEGSLIIDVLDAKTVKVVWRGSARAEMTEQANDEDKDKRVKEAVTKMLEKFPPEK